jgi:hypothetical protein
MDETPIERMTDADRNVSDRSIDGAPVWVRVFQAAAIGVVAGLALNGIVSMVSLHGETLTPKHAPPKQCKKQAPAKDSASPKVSGPTMGAVSWTVDGVQASVDRQSDVLLTR